MGKRQKKRKIDYQPKGRTGNGGKRKRDNDNMMKTIQSDHQADYNTSPSLNEEEKGTMAPVPTNLQADVPGIPSLSNTKDKTRSELPAFRKIIERNCHGKCCQDRKNWPKL